MTDWSVSEKLEHIAKSLDNIANILEKIANPPMAVHPAVYDYVPATPISYPNFYPQWHGDVSNPTYAPAQTMGTQEDR